MIKKLRVDHRLLHGQVAFSWTQAIGADCILIANDGIFQDSIKLTALKLAKPSGVKVVIKTIEDAIIAIKSGITDKYKLFIIVESIADAKHLSEAIAYSEINLGGTKAEEGKKQLSKAIFVSDAEVCLLKEMLEAGFQLQVQMIPAEKSVDVKTLI